MQKIWEVPPLREPPQHRAAPKAGLLSDQAREELGWSEADAREIRIVAHAWAGSRFEPYRTWTLDPGPRSRLSGGGVI